MFSTALISFREFLEAFLIIGMFLGVAKKLKLPKTKEILLAAGAGIIFSLVLPVIVYLSGERVRGAFTEDQVDIIQGYLMVFSSFFIAYVILSLHKLFKAQHEQSLRSVKEKSTGIGFDFSLFLTVFIFIIREGFEVALFTSTISLLSTFVENLWGLLLGFALSFVAGALVYTAYIRLPLRNIFRYTEYLIMILGAAMLKNGLSKLFEHGLGIHLGDFGALPLTFLPSSEGSFIGHAFKNILGLESELSILKIAIMAAYLALVYWFTTTSHSSTVKAE